MLYPQNGDRIVTINSVTSHQPMYNGLKPTGIYIQLYFTIVYGSTTYTHTRLTALFPGLPGWAGTRKVKPIWILLKQRR